MSYSSYLTAHKAAAVSSFFKTLNQFDTTSQATLKTSKENKTSADLQSVNQSLVPYPSLYIANHFRRPHLYLVLNKYIYILSNTLEGVIISKLLLILK
jgi:hypothetical protein